MAALIRSEIRFILQNDRIHAIKSVRDRIGCGLKEAKEAVEDFMRDVGLVQETRCPHCQGRGVVENFAMQISIKPKHFNDTWHTED